VIGCHSVHRDMGWHLWPEREKREEMCTGVGVRGRTEKGSGGRPENRRNTKGGFKDECPVKGKSRD